MTEADNPSELEKGESLLRNQIGLQSNRIDSPRPFNDTTFAVIFAIQTISVAVLAFSYGFRAIDSAGPSSVTVQKDNTEVFNSSNRESQIKLLGGIFFIAFMGGFLSIGWIYVMTNLASELINFTFTAASLACFLSGITFFTSGQVLTGVCLMLCGLFIVLMYIYLRPRMDLACVTLRIACEAVKTMPSTVYFSVLALCVQIIFCIVWTIAVMGIATNEANSTISASGHTYSLSQCLSVSYSENFDIHGITLPTCPSGKTCASCLCGDSLVFPRQSCFSAKINGWSYFLMLLSLLWFSTVVTNVVHCTTSGAVYSWWCSDSIHSSRTAVVKASFRNATTSSFGSICLGSLLVAVLKTVRAVAKFAADNMKKVEAAPTVRLRLFVMGCLESFLGFLDRAMEFFNRYAFCYVAMYGHSFFESSKQVLDLFRSRGFTAMINDEIVDIVLSVGHFLVALLCAILGYVYGVSVNMGTVNVTLLTLLGCFGGYLMCAVTMKVISSAVATSYVCFAEAPEDFEAAHPDLYYKIVAAWLALYPNSDPTGRGKGAGPSGLDGSTNGGSYLPPSSSEAGAAGAPAGRIKHSGGATLGAYSFLPTAGDDDDDDAAAAAARSSPYGNSSSSSSGGSSSSNSSSNGLNSVLTSVGIGFSHAYSGLSQLIVGSNSSSAGAFNSSTGRFPPSFSSPAQPSPTRGDPSGAASEEEEVTVSF